MKKLLFALLVMASAICFGHPGGLDSRGGHRDGKNGGYHYHNGGGGSASREFLSPGGGFSASMEENARQANARRDKLKPYFDRYNAGILRWRGAATKRDGGAALREQVLKRDGGKCIICGSTANLEVDHARALANGGASGLGNCFTLCNTCHGQKTALDMDLLEKRRAAGLVQE